MSGSAIEPARGALAGGTILLRCGREPDLPELIATVRCLEGEIGEAEADVAHFSFEASLAELLGAPIDVEANTASIDEARRRLGRLHQHHAAASRRVGDAIRATRGSDPRG